MYKFVKKEKLRTKKLNQTIYTQGIHYRTQVLKFLYLCNNDSLQLTSHKNLFLVQKSKIKKSVDRNRIRRKLREAYRYEKYLLKNFFVIVYQYLSKDVYPCLEMLRKEFHCFFTHLNEWHHVADR